MYECVYSEYTVPRPHTENSRCVTYIRQFHMYVCRLLATGSLPKIG